MCKTNVQDEKRRNLKHKNKTDLSLLAEIAQLYYEENKTQEEIAKLLGLSRFKVSRLLQKAREEGIVAITVRDPFLSCEDLEQELKEKFNLEEVIVISGGYLPEELVRQEIGRFGASLFQSVVQDGDIIEVGWGTTTYECIKRLESMEKRDITVVPLGGGTGQIEPHFQVNEFSKKVARSFGGKSYVLDIPIFVENIVTKNVLLKEPRVKKVIDLWEKLTVAVVGIGNIPGLWKSRSPLVALSNEAIRILKEEISIYGIVGDIAQNYFDIKGDISPVSIRENIISVPIEQVRCAKKIIALSGGESKKESVLGALRGGFITHLVTDESVAKYILNNDNVEDSLL